MKNNTNSDYKTTFQSLKPLAQGQWINIISSIDPRFKEAANNVGAHVPCPLGTGSKDGFRFTKESDIDGHAFTNTGEPLGDGFSVLKWAGLSNKEAQDAVSNYLNQNQPNQAKTKPPKKSPGKTKNKNLQNILNKTWTEAHAITEPVKRYLENRGLAEALDSLPKSLKAHDGLEYKHEGQLLGKFPALIARITKGKEPLGIQRHFITPEGIKADISIKDQEGKEKKLTSKMMLTSGGNITGGSIQLRPITNNRELAITEGVENGLAIMLGAPDLPVWAATTGAMLSKVEVPDRINHVFIFEDKDPNGAGEKYATSLTTRLEEKGVKVTRCVPPLDIDRKSKKGVDWLDVLNRLSKDEIAQAMQQPEKEPARQKHPETEKLPYYKVLGYNHGSYFFISRKQQQIVELKANTLNKQHLLQLAPLDSWINQFPKYNKDNLLTGADWDGITDHLIRESERTGVYSLENIRGRGFWWDRNRLIRHTGNGLQVEGENVDLLKHDSDYVYEKAHKLKVTNAKPTTKKEAGEIIRAASAIYWKKPESAMLFLGWCVIAPFCGALNWRPHIWITGPKGCGKSDTAIPLIKNLVGFHNMVMAEGETSEAGIRQALKSDGFPVVLDEMEQHDQKDRNRVQRIMALARNSSSEGEARTYKGTVSGNNLAYHIRSTFAYASINVNFEQEADASRTTILEIEGQPVTPESTERFKGIKQLVAKLEQEGGAEKLIAYTTQNFELLKQNIAILEKVIAEQHGDARKGKQYGALLAGFWLLDRCTLITETEATCLAGMTKIDNYTEDQETEGDEQRCLDAIMAVHMRLDELKSMTVTIGEGLEILANNDKEKLANIAGIGEFGLEGNKGRAALESILKRHGIIFQHKDENRYGVKGQGFYIANTNETLSKALRDTSYTAWKTILKRIDNSTTVSKLIKINGSPKRALFIPYL